MLHLKGCMFFVSLLYLFHSGVSLTYFGFPSPLPSRYFAPTYLSRQQWPGNVDWTKFGANYSAKVPIDGIGCNPSTVIQATTPNQMLIGNQLALPCDYNVQQLNAQDKGYNALLAATVMPQFLANFLTVSGPYRYGVPIVYSGFPVSATVADQAAFPAAVVALSMVSKGLNITIYIDLPDIEPIYESLTVITGLIYNVRWIGISYAIFSLVLCTCKLAIFITMSGRVQLSIPQVALFSCSIGSIFVIMDGLWVIFGLYETAANLGAKFFELWGFTWALSACLLVGFYFREIAGLTTAQSLPFLDKLIFPFIGVVSLLWACQIVLSFLTTYPPPAAVSSVSGGFGNLFLAIYALVGVCTLTIVAWGATSLIKSSSGISQNRRTMVLLTVSMTIFASCSAVATAIAYLVLRFFPTTTIVLSYTAVTYAGTGVGFLLFAPTTSFVVYGFMFRVVLEKEVELSKSATSSTNGSSQSSSSAHSSSSAEPVIEL